MAIDSTSPRTRRAILLGALGGVTASVAAAVGRASQVDAADGDTVKVGDYHTGTGTTIIDVTGDSAFKGNSDSANGVVGTTNSGNGVYGFAFFGTGVYGKSESGKGVQGDSPYTGTAVSGHNADPNQPAILGEAYGHSTGVHGHSGGSGVPSAPAKTGVYGTADQGAASIGVLGRSVTGRGGAFSGKLAQLRLAPSSAASHPASGLPGDLFVDRSKRLWFCLGGTIWKQVSLV